MAHQLVMGTERKKKRERGNLAQLYLHAFGTGKKPMRTHGEHAQKRAHAHEQ